ncbi:helix-turn-helix transcriptional regulator [Pseudochelatococcus sp. B33]
MRPVAALHLPLATVAAIISGRDPMIPDVATRLARYFGNSTDFRLALQSAYDDGATWAHMDARPRLSFAALTHRADVPTAVGVYALYRTGERVHGGIAGAPGLGQPCPLQAGVYQKISIAEERRGASRHRFIRRHPRDAIHPDVRSTGGGEG